MDLKQLKAIVKIMRNEGVLSLKTQEIELTLAHESLLPKNTSKSIQIEEEPMEGELSPEELMFYSANPDSTQS